MVNLVGVLQSVGFHAEIFSRMKRPLQVLLPDRTIANPKRISFRINQCSVTNQDLILLFRERIHLRTKDGELIYVAGRERASLFPTRFPGFRFPERKVDGESYLFFF